MVTDSGTRFWDAAVNVPLEQLEVTPATRALLEKTMLFTPLPYVTRVVFIATPHRGSFRAPPSSGASGGGHRPLHHRGAGGGSHHLSPVAC